MKRLATILSLMLLPLGVLAQPTVDGNLSVADQLFYNQLASWTQANTGFGDHGMLELWAYADATDLYIMIVGEAESNFNEFYAYIGATTPSGVSAGTQLPAGSDGGSPFANARPTLDFEGDYALRLTSGNASNAFVSIVNYTSGGNTDTFLGTIANDGTPSTVSGGLYDGTDLAYNDTGSLTAHSGTEGWEMSIPLSSIGANVGDSFELFALYGNDDFISANSLPEIAGQSGTNLASNPDFSGIAGDQHTTANTLPIELASFTARADHAAAVLTWTTASETNNSGFAIQQRQGGRFETLGFVAGAGTTTEAQAYAFRVEDLAPGTYAFRLQQQDFDGTISYSPVVEVTLGVPEAYLLSAAYPNPFNPATRFTLSIAEAQPVTIAVYDLLGRRVALLHEGPLAADEAHAFTFQAGALPTGLYFLRATGTRFQAVRTVQLVK